MVVLCIEHQLSDVLHFCCDAFCFSILGMNPHSIWESSVLFWLCIDTCCYIILTPDSHHYFLAPSLYTSKSSFTVKNNSFPHWMAWSKNSHWLNPLTRMVKRIWLMPQFATFHKQPIYDASSTFSKYLHEEQFPLTVIKLLVGDIFILSNSDGTHHEELVDSGDAHKPLMLNLMIWKRSTIRCLITNHFRVYTSLQAQCKSSQAAMQSLSRAMLLKTSI